MTETHRSLVNTVAVEALTTAIASLRTQHQEGYRDNFLKRHADFRAQIVRLLGCMPTYWPAAATSLVLEASKALDLGRTIVSRDAVYFNDAFCWFESPVLQVFARTGDPVFLPAVSWHLVHRAESQRDYLRVVGYMQAGPHLVAVAKSDFPLGLSASAARFESRDMGEWSKEAPPMLQWVMAASSLLHQRILQIRRVPIPRQAMRRLTTAEMSQTQVDVMTIRRSEYRRRHGVETPGPEWHCQWLMNGHWRQQFYPATNRKMPIWIHDQASHGRGTED